MSVLDKLMKNSTLALTTLLSESELYEEKDAIPTDIPMINVALSGKLDGGLTSGLTMIAGPSKHFKSAFSLLLAASYMKHYPDSVMLFYDSEFGMPMAYFKQFGIDTARVMHCPITDVEQLKNDLMVQLNGTSRGDHVIIVIDSIGNLASKKEVDDALEGKSVADMTRAKQIKSLFRMATPHLSIKNIPLVVVNHTYKEIGMFPKDIVGGGTGSYYSSDTIWIVGRQQEKEGKSVMGYNFIVNIEKSRFVKEKSQIPIRVMFNGGIEKYSGLFDIAMECGIIKEAGKGWYIINDTDVSTTKRRRADIEDDTAFFEKLLKNDEFSSFVTKKYKLIQEES